MTTRYVLIDHENVQPKDLAVLDGQPWRVIVFLGAKQARLSADLAMALQARGADGAYVKVNANGRNALDLHIAFHLGELAAKEPSATFRVISKDGDYEPLLEHLRSRGIDACREEAMACLLPLEEHSVVQVTDYLRSPATGRPKNLKKLANAINARLGSNRDPVEINRLIAELARRRVIAISGDQIAYL